MSEWRGVLKYRGDYYTAERPRWSPLREDAHVFNSHDRATQIARELRQKHVEKHDADPRIIVTRLRRRRDRFADESRARIERQEADRALRVAERERIAKWFEVWLRLNAALVTSTRFTAGDPHKKSFTLGMISVLEQAARRIRAGNFQSEWEYRP